MIHFFVLVWDSGSGSHYRRIKFCIEICSRSAKFLDHITFKDNNTYMLTSNPIAVIFLNPQSQTLNLKPIHLPRLPAAVIILYPHSQTSNPNPLILTCALTSCPIAVIFFDPHSQTLNPNPFIHTCALTSCPTAVICLIFSNSSGANFCSVGRNWSS